MTEKEYGPIYDITDGGCELDDCYTEDLPEGYQWAMFWYEPGDWEGSGEMIVKLADGNFVSADMGHCSCYGPLEDEHFDLSESITGDRILNDLCGLDNIVITKPMDSWRGKETMMMLEKFCELEGIDFDKLKEDRKNS